MFSALFKVDGALIEPFSRTPSIFYTLNSLLWSVDICEQFGPRLGAMEPHLDPN